MQRFAEEVIPRVRQARIGLLGIGPGSRRRFLNA